MCMIGVGAARRFHHPGGFTRRGGTPRPTWGRSRDGGLYPDVVTAAQTVPAATSRGVRGAGLVPSASRPDGEAAFRRRHTGFSARGR